VNVLYLSHTGAMSGAEHSLLELLGHLPDGVSPTLAAPAGLLGSAAQELGLPFVAVRGTDVSLRLHPWHTSKGVAAIVRGATELRRLARRSRADLVHANTTRAGLIAVLAAKGGGPPVVVHVRDFLPETLAANMTRRLISAGAAIVLANSRYTAAAFARDGARARVRTVYNGVDLARFDPANYSGDETRQGLGYQKRAVLLGVVGQITPWKGQEDAVRTLALVRRDLPEARLLLVGEPKFTAAATRYDNAAYEAGLRRLAVELGLGESVRFLGERQDVPALLHACDLVLVPSWEEPFGRTVVEAMAMERPVLATNVGGPAEIVTDGEDGVLLPPRQPAVWAEAILRLVARPDLREELGRRARRKVSTTFTLDAHVRAVIAAYEDVLRVGEHRGER
jgi:glycosyltransferase involved in cell wall biosynthesis